ncbi:uncharacterized protein LOC118416409 [Branchiostoma floridae]|uniref:Uncharacterized protein LOC118416409 n=1 Tax=Branchiostoma floridae TaxID=7739 RepID=A0A9J7L8P5_BRAFL|nr:uncharacterized protein LOC118416409 [Branchiostoma floridae]
MSKTNIDECASNPCNNGGTCTDGVNGYTCDCAAGYAGDDCKTDIDECASDPCNNGGTCTDGVNGYTCDCAEGYVGDTCNCETDIDECASNPCNNGGTCTDGVNSYTCDCAEGYTGDNCETGVVRKYFYFIKEEVSSDWKDLAYQLGVKQADINNIAGKKQDDKSCCMDLLCEWLESNGARATIEVLMEALSEAKLQSIVDELKTKYPELTEQRQPVGANQAQTESMKAPEGLKALETTNDSVKLGWTKVNSNQTSGYRLEQSIAFEENWVSAQGDRKLLPATITEFTVVDLSPYKEYHFCVRSAIDRMGKLVLSERSVPLYVVAKQPYQPYRPRNLKLTDHTHASLSLTWKEPSPADDVNPACYEYVVEMCAHGNDQGVKRWTEYCRTTQCNCPINDQDNGIYRFRVSANNTENDVTSLPEEMGDPVIPIHIKTKSEWLIEVLKTFWPFSATTQPRSQESGSIIFNISCHDLEGLRDLWMNYKLGKVKKFFENLFARLARLSSVQTDTELEIRIDKEDFYSCRRHLLLTMPTSKGFRVVRLGEGDSRGTRLGLSEDYPVYCKPISHKTTCSQLDFLDPAIPVDQLGLDRDELSALPCLNRQVHCSSLPGLDLAVVREDLSYKQGDSSKLRAAVRASREKSQRLEVQLHAAKTQLETGRQETKALKKGVAKMTEEREKAQKIILEHKIEIEQLQETNKNWEEGMQRSRQQTEALMLNLSREVTRLTKEKEKAQRILQEQKIEIQHLQENNKSMTATIEELLHAKHTAKGESGEQVHGRKEGLGSEKGRKGEQEKGAYTGETGPWKKEESDIEPPSTSQPKKTVPRGEEDAEARKQVKADPDGAGPSGSGEMDQEPQTSHSAGVN